MLSGIVITTVFESSLNLATLTVDDMVSGFMKEVLVSPVKRIYISMGQLLSAATVATIQGCLVLILGMFIGIRFTSWVTPFFIIISMIFVGIVFSSVGLYLATKVRNGQTFQIVKMAVTMPLTFISGAYIPLSLLPESLRYVSYFNPMTYATAFLEWSYWKKSTYLQIS